MVAVLEKTGAAGLPYEEDTEEQENRVKLQGGIIIESHGLNSDASMWTGMNSYLQEVDRNVIYCGRVNFKKYPQETNDYLCFEPKVLEEKWYPIKKYRDKLIGRDKERNYLMESGQQDGPAYLKVREEDVVVKSGLFTEKDLIDLNKQMKARPMRKRQILTSAVKDRVAELVRAGKTVIFDITYYNNQDDFRLQGAELKQAINMVKPDGMKVDVIGHSMGGLAIASYIAGIAWGKPYEYDIDQFLALGTPFNGSPLAYPADFIDGSLSLEKNFPIQDKILMMTNPVYVIVKKLDKSCLSDFHERGPAYENLERFSKATQELRKEWSRLGDRGVSAYSLQADLGDGVVTKKSSFSLKHMKHYTVEKFCFHCSQANSRVWQEAVYKILAMGYL